MATSLARRKPRRELTSDEAKRAFADCLERVAFLGERVIVKRYKRAMVAIVGMDDLQKLEEHEAA